MKMRSKFVEVVGADELRRAVWLTALTRHAGNIAQTAAEFGFSKQRGHAITRRCGLVAAARELRMKAGQAATGRPKKDPKKVN